MNIKSNHFYIWMRCKLKFLNFIFHRFIICKIGYHSETFEFINQFKQDMNTVRCFYCNKFLYERSLNRNEQYPELLTNDVLKVLNSYSIDNLDELKDDRIVEVMKEAFKQNTKKA